LKLTATLLLVLLLLNSFFYCLYYNVCRWQREDEVKTGIANNRYNREATLVKIPAAVAAAPMLDDDEITWNGMLFDVVKRLVAHDTVYIYALPDEQEQALVDKINDYISGGLSIQLLHSCTLHPVIHLVKLLPQLYIQQLQGRQQVLHAGVHAAYCYNNGLYCHAYTDIPVPPPKQPYAKI
jgi:hypothetical protein